MHITACPVSGGGMVSQAALFTVIPDISDVILASSGGCIATYIAMGADFNPYSVSRILGCLRSSMLIKTWWPYPMDLIPSWVAGYSRGSYYNTGSGVESLYQGIFTPDLITRKEVWMGTTMVKTSKCQLFCNKKQKNVSLDVDEFTYDEFNTMPLRYLDGNISDISAISLASASIPSFVPPVVFNGDQYVDGGATYASPLSPMSPILRSYKTLHIDYINSFDINSQTELNQNTITSLVKTTTTEMIHSMIISDRSNGIELIRKGNRKLKFYEFCCDQELLESLYDFRKNVRRSFLELYPKNAQKVELDAYDHVLAREILWNTRREFKCRFWWTPRKSEEAIPEEFAFIRDNCYSQTFA